MNYRVLDVRDVERVLRGALDRVHRKDIEAEVGIFLEFTKKGDPKGGVCQIAINPREPFPKFRARQLVDDVVAKLDGTDEAASTEVSTALVPVVVERAPVLVGAAVRAAIDTDIGGTYPTQSPGYGSTTGLPWEED